VAEAGRGGIRAEQPLLLYPARIEERVRREDITPHQGTGTFCKEKPKNRLLPVSPSPARRRAGKEGPKGMALKATRSSKNSRKSGQGREKEREWKKGVSQGLTGNV